LFVKTSNIFGGTIYITFLTYRQTISVNIDFLSFKIVAFEISEFLNYSIVEQKDLQQPTTDGVFSKGVLL
jgi:hypothetical protein